MVERRASFRQRHPWVTWIASVCLILLAVITAAMAIIAARLQPILRASLVAGLEQKFHTRVELDHFHVALGNGLNGEWGIWATGKGLRIWPPQHTGGDRPLEISVQSIPLISLDEFRFHVPLHFERGKPVKISRVRLTGLKIVVPPRSERDKAHGIESATSRQKPSPGHREEAQGAPPANQAPANQAANPGPADNSQAGGGTLANVVIGRIDCERAQLILETDKPNKLPLGFDIAQLRLTEVSAQKPMKFEAELTNPQPKGVIHTSGNLGPWRPDDPGETAVNGAYTFDHADLATFHGIAGILSSTGNYAGTLRDMRVDGHVDVPDFQLPRFGNPVPLHTQFHAKVDGTDGDTWLDPVDATLGHSHFVTRGQVVRIRPPETSGPVTSANLPPLADIGHQIDLKVDVDRGRIEDFLRLATKTQAPTLTGVLHTKAVLHIPAGKGPVHERLRLDGQFDLEDVIFTDKRVQDKIEDLSLRGQGRPQDLKAANPATVTSQMEGEFHMEHAVIHLPDIHYTVPGADIELHGTYPLEGFMLFQGTARMQATVSKMVGGWKGWLLRPADRFFKKDGAGTVVPILIRGPHDQPEFSLDFGRTKHTSPETPGRGNQD